jgi:hypothetical protein
MNKHSANAPADDPHYRAAKAALGAEGAGE